MNALRNLARHKWLAVILVVAVVAIILGPLQAAWASSQAQPNRQTVPTPTPKPKTKTPVPPTATPTPETPLIIIVPTPIIPPGGDTPLIIRIKNPNPKPCANVKITFAPHPCLTLSGMQVSRGTVGGSPIVWDVGTLAPGEELELTLTAKACADLLPGQCLDVMATMTWDCGQPIPLTVQLCAPTAILPPTGE